MRPLAGLRVLDLSRVLAGPYCTMLLGDLGADVLKVERPGTGDDTRGWGPPFAAGESAYYLSCNRNKRGIAIDLKTPAGRALIADLAAWADVLVENFVPGTLEGWNLGYEDLSQRNPRLVYCSITGFGQTGPWRDAPGYDIMIQALSGLMSITGEADGPPTKLGVAVADLTTGMLASNAILAALWDRERTGRGAYIDMALFDSTLSWLANIGENHLVSGQVPVRQGTAHPNIVPYQAFDTRDGTIIVAVGNDRQFARFCELLEADDLARDPRFQTNAGRVEHRGLLVPLIAARLRLRSSDDWLRQLATAGIPASPVLNVAEALSTPQAAARDMVWTLSHPTIGPLSVVGSAFKYDAGPPAPRRPPPRLGEHTDEVLSEVLGLTPADLQELHRAQVIGGPPAVREG